jgi:hypothetical protein
MKLRSMLQPDSATMVGVLTAAGVYLIYNNALPSAADIRTTPANNPDVESARKAAAWKSAALITLVFLVARDLNSYIISGAALVGIDYVYKHSNAVAPGTGKLESSGGGAAVYPLPEYDSGETG